MNMVDLSVSCILSVEQSTAHNMESSELSQLVTNMSNLSLKSIIETLQNRSRKSEMDIVELRMESDQFFLILMSIIIFFMQCGFAFLEAGSVR